MSEDDARKLTLDQLWLDPSIFSEDIAFDAGNQLRHHDWQQQAKQRRDEEGSKAALVNAFAPGPANSSITPTEIPVRAWHMLKRKHP